MLLTVNGEIVSGGGKPEVVWLKETADRRYDFSFSFEDAQALAKQNKTKKVRPTVLPVSKFLCACICICSPFSSQRKYFLGVHIEPSLMLSVLRNENSLSFTY